MAPIRKTTPKKINLKKKNLKKFRKVKKVNVVRKGAVFFSNLPHGFYERALNGYLQQFGEVTKIKVAKSLKNAKPMGYAYVEFEHEKVALIVARTMNKYLMFKKLLKCEFIRHENINNKMWADAEISPELCPGTINRRRNQYLLETGTSKTYTEKKEAKSEKILNYLKKTMGMNLDEDNETKLMDKNTMELDNSKSEISPETELNVKNVIKKKQSSLNKSKDLICDGNASLIKKMAKKRSLSTVEDVSRKSFHEPVKDENSKKLRMHIAKESKNTIRINSEKMIKRVKSDQVNKVSKIKSSSKFQISDVTSKKSNSIKPPRNAAKLTSIKSVQLTTNKKSDSSESQRSVKKVQSTKITPNSKTAKNIAMKSQDKSFSAKVTAVKTGSKILKKTGKSNTPKANKVRSKIQFPVSV